MVENVIVVRANEALNKEVISNMLANGVAPSFKAAKERIESHIQYIVILDTAQTTFYRADICSVSSSVKCEPGEKTSEGRVDIYFKNPAKLSSTEITTLINQINLKGSNPVRYTCKFWP